METPPPPPPSSAVRYGETLPASKTSGLAISALVFGILSFIGGVFFLLPPILAIVFGHLSVSQCNKNPRLGGKGLGIAGLVMGYVAVVILVPLMAAMAIPAFQKVRQNSQDRAVFNNVRMLAMSADQYYLENGVSTAGLSDLVGSDKYMKQIQTIANESYPERYTRGVTITVKGVAGTRTVTYSP